MVIIRVVNGLAFSMVTIKISPFCIFVAAAPLVAPKKNASMMRPLINNIAGDSSKRLQDDTTSYYLTH